jgi:hypothetical protein
MLSDRQSIPSFRLADLLVALALVADLGMRHAPEEVVSACFLATGLARRLGLSEPEVGDVYYTTLLRFTGCTAYAHEDAQLSAGDDVAMRAAGAARDLGSFRDLARDAPLLRRAGAVFRTLAQGQRGTDEMFRSHCEVAIMLARRLGLGSTVQQALQHAFERWDGRGSPQQLRRDTVAAPARFAQVAYKGILFLCTAVHGSAYPNAAPARRRQPAVHQKGYRSGRCSPAQQPDRRHAGSTARRHEHGPRPLCARGAGLFD